MREALKALEKSWRKAAQTHEDHRHVLDDPYDDAGHEHSVKARLLRSCADQLAALLVEGSDDAGWQCETKIFCDCGKGEYWCVKKCPMPLPSAPAPKET